jgi:hypothetical protein
MFGDTTVRAQAEIIADPRKLLAEIDGLSHSRRPQNMSEYLSVMADVRKLIVGATQTEYVQVNVEAGIMDQNSDYIDFVNDKLRTAMGDRLVRVVGPVVTVMREEE